MTKTQIYIILLILAIILLFAMNLFIGSVKIPMEAVCNILLGDSNIKATWQYIILDSRLPQAVTALLSGAALSVSGLLLQTAFRNSLAGPDVFGVNSGAALAVALVMLGMGGSMSIGTYSFTGFLAILISAFVGAMLVTGIIFLFSTMVRNKVLLLIVGIMIGYLTSSIISLLNYFATEEGVKSYVIWGMGTFSNVTRQQLLPFCIITLLGLLLAFSLAKPLNIMLLGEEYAENLGINTRRLRHILLIVTGILTAIVTAFCGPIAFIGLATPHIARLLLRTDNHRTLLPFTLLMGSVIALLCNFICTLPRDGSIIPLNAVTPLIGAPVIIYILTKKA